MVYSCMGINTGCYVLPECSKSSRYHIAPILRFLYFLSGFTGTVSCNYYLKKCLVLASPFTYLEEDMKRAVSEDGINS